MVLPKMTPEQKAQCIAMLEADQIDVPWAARRYGVTRGTINELWLEHRKAKAQEAVGGA